MIALNIGLEGQVGADNNLPLIPLQGTYSVPAKQENRIEERTTFSL